MAPRTPSRDAVVGGLVVAPTLVWMGFVATEGAGRWPWAGFVILAAAPFLLLLIPPVSARLRALLAGHPSRPIGVLAVIAAYGVGLSIASGASRWYSVLLWPICIAFSTLAAFGAVLSIDTSASDVVRRRIRIAVPTVASQTEMSSGWLLLTALGVWILAGVWDWRLQVRVPGDIDIGLPFFAALDVALILLLVVRPLRTLDLGLGLRGRDLLAALGAVAVLMIAALPAGYVIGFLRFNVRWNGLAYAAARLFGLVLFIGLPEELLFRGIIQEAFSRLWGGRAGWITASVLFGMTHIVKRAPPLNWRYALLATFAGLAYGWVYRRTGRLAAAALTHGLVDWIWSTFLLVP